MRSLRHIAFVVYVFIVMSPHSFAEASEDATSFLFVQTAKGVKFGDGTLTMRGV